MELLEAIQKRRTVRKFLPEAVSEETLKKLVGRALLAPSVNALRPWRFIAVTDRTLLNRMADCVEERLQELFGRTDKESLLQTVIHFSTLFREAPAVLFIAAQPSPAVADKLEVEGLDHNVISELRQRPDLQSVGAAVQNILLSAVEFGLGACWLSGLMVARAELEAMLKVERPWELVTAVAIGKPESVPPPQQPPSPDSYFILLK